MRRRIRHRPDQLHPSRNPVLVGKANERLAVRSIADQAEPQLGSCGQRESLHGNVLALLTAKAAHAHHQGSAPAIGDKTFGAVAAYVDPILDHTQSLRSPSESSLTNATFFLRDRHDDVSQRR
jgi:hypothetical protein